MKRVIILFSGVGSNLEYLIKNVVDQEIVGTITNNPKAKGIEISQRYDIPCHVIDSKLFSSREDFDSRLVEQISQYKYDLVILAGFMRILTPIFTQHVKAINLHPSLLPRHKGLNAIENSYADEFLFGGVTVHYVSSELDGGDIILQREVAKENLIAREYEAKIKEIEKEVLLEGMKIALYS